MELFSWSPEMECRGAVPRTKVLVPAKPELAGGCELRSPSSRSARERLLQSARTRPCPIRVGPTQKPPLRIATLSALGAP
eukprot:14789562-Alexandrium_andersonii.AAC.2